MLMTNKFRSAGVLSILRKLSGAAFCGPPILVAIDNTIISLLDFPQAARDVELEHFQMVLNAWNRINNAVYDLLISSIQADAEPLESLFPIINTNKLLDPEHSVNVPASHIFEYLSKYFIERMGACEQIKTKCQTITTRLSTKSHVSLIDSELRMLFSDYKFRDIHKEI